MSSSTLDIAKINAIAEFERIGLPFEPRSDSEVAFCCPVHGDKTPSASINIEKNLWKCHAAGCGAKGDIISLIALHLKSERNAVRMDIAERYGLVEAKALNPDLVQKWHEAIWKSGPLLKALRDRGISDEDIRNARLGYHGGRITIPIYDESRRIVNIRHYLPGAASHEKMRNTKGYGSPASLYQIEQLKHPRVWVCGGEMKALVTGRLLQEHGVGAVAVTAGEGAWEPIFTSKFTGKDVYVCMDVDAGGRTAARNLASILSTCAKTVRIIRLPLDREKFPKGDINDYVAKMGASAGDLLHLMELAEPFQAVEDEKELLHEEVELGNAARSGNIGKRITLEAVVQSIDETPFLVPKEVGASCTRDQPNCSFCPIRSMEPDETTGYVTLTIKGTSYGLLSAVNAPSSKQREALMECLRIPSCKAVKFAIRSHYNVFDVRLAPQLQITGKNSDYVSQAALIVGSDHVELNTPYTLGGRVYPHPKNQQGVLLLDLVEPSRDNLADFRLTDEELSSLSCFEVGSATIEERLDQLYEDLETNVTRIFFRRDLHLLIDLTFFSPLYLTFDGETHKGWVNSVVVGDSSQGKSESTMRLMQHYQLGERVDCKNASAAGLIGGVQKTGNDRWMITWGIIPTHDRRLVVLEEVKGTPTEVLARLTDMRSSGVAEIPKIEKRRAHARTRLIFLSNPRSDRPINTFNFGIEAIRELIGGLEDVRRFDIGMVVSSSQVDAKKIAALNIKRPETPHIFTSDISRLLVLWAWTRRPDQVQFTREAEVLCFEGGSDLCSKFSDAMPLIDRGTTGIKVARLAAALAARLFSHPDGDPESLLVHIEHVRFILRFIDRLYSDPIMGYADFSRAQEFATKMLDEEVVGKNIRASKYPREFIEHLLHTDSFSVQDVMDWCEVNEDEGQRLVSLFVRKHAIYRVKRDYVKTPAFIEFLKRSRATAKHESGFGQQEF